MKDKVVLITGAAKRVGACVAKTLHDNGAKVIVHYRGSKTAAEELVDEMNQARPDSALALQADLSDMVAVERLGNEALSVWGKVDALINNASSFYPTALGSVTEKQWADLFSSNVKAPFFLAQTLLSSLKGNKGNIINMVDVHADRPLKDHPVYCMAKAALVSMTKSMAKDLAPDVRVNAIAPGMILWPDDEALDERVEKYLMNRIALKRFGEPKNIAESILFILQQDYMTGQVLAIDGGRTLTI